MPLSGIRHLYWWTPCCAPPRGGVTSRHSGFVFDECRASARKPAKQRLIILDRSDVAVAILDFMAAAVLWFVLVAKGPTLLISVVRGLGPGEGGPDVDGEGAVGSRRSFRLVAPTKSTSWAVPRAVSMPSSSFSSVRTTKSLTHRPEMTNGQIVFEKLNISNKLCCHNKHSRPPAIVDIVLYYFIC